MTIDEFNRTSWGANMECFFNGKLRDIVIVNFDQGLLALDNGQEDTDDLDWVRCENIKLPFTNRTIK